MNQPPRQPHGSADASGNTGDSEPDTPALPPEFVALFKSEQRLERFEHAVRRYFERRKIDYRLVLGSVHARIDGQDHTLGLDNVAQMCASAPDDEVEALVADHFDTIARTAEASRRLEKDLSDFSKIRPKLTLLLYPPTTLPEGGESIRRTRIEGIEEFLGVDLGESIVSLRRDAVAPWNKSDDELFEIALANAAACARPDDAITLDPEGLIVVMHDASIFGAARTIAGGGYPDRHGLFGAFVSMPTKHLTILTPFDGLESMQSLGAVMRIATGMFHEGPRSLSPNVYWVREGHWMAIPYETNGDQIDVNPPEPLVELLNSLGGGDENTPHEAGDDEDDE